MAYARTAPEKLNVSLAKFKEWLSKNRSLGTSEIFLKVRAKLRGYYNYYGLTGNFESLQSYFYYFKGILKKYLNKRSQRLSCNWGKFKKLLRIYGVPRPRITWNLKQYPKVWDFV